MSKQDCIRSLKETLDAMSIFNQNLPPQFKLPSHPPQLPIIPAEFVEGYYPSNQPKNKKDAFAPRTEKDIKKSLLCKPLTYLYEEPKISKNEDIECEWLESTEEMGNEDGDVNPYWTAMTQQAELIPSLRRRQQKPQQVEIDYQQRNLDELEQIERRFSYRSIPNPTVILDPKWNILYSPISSRK